MRKRIELEYIFSSSVKVLYSRLSTPAGLAEWFADDVIQKGNQFIFVWNKTEQSAMRRMKMNILSLKSMSSPLRVMLR